MVREKSLGARTGGRVLREPQSLRNVVQYLVGYIVILRNERHCPDGDLRVPSVVDDVQFRNVRQIVQNFLSSD
jgi:hypothetical protein